jgi:hypothetical protein
MRGNLMRLSLVLMFMACCAQAGDAPPGPASKPADPTGKLPHVQFDARKKQVRVECEMLAVDAPLEFFCCVEGTNDYEAMIRSKVKPSNLHLAMLAIGLAPGKPLTYSEAMKKWIPPQGPPLDIFMEYEKDGKTVSTPAWKWMRDIRSKKTAPPFKWVFAGSRVMPDGKYAADVTGYLVSLANVDITVIDVPELLSRSTAQLEWERNPDVTPKAGTKVWMVIEPSGNEHDRAGHAPKHQAPQSRPSTPHIQGDTAGDVNASVHAAQENVKQLRDQWEKQVGPQRDALRSAAEAHYEVMRQLRAQQQKLIDQADHIQQTIDELEKEYQDLTTPRPETK